MYRLRNLLRRLKRNYDFEVAGIVNGVKQKFRYIKKGKKVEYIADNIVKSLFEECLKKDTPIGPVGQYMDRNINNPLVVLCILTNEVFDEVIETKGTLPEADEIPPGSIC